MWSVRITPAAMFRVAQIWLSRGTVRAQVPPLTLPPLQQHNIAIISIMDSTTLSLILGQISVAAQDSYLDSIDYGVLTHTALIDRFRITYCSARSRFLDDYSLMNAGSITYYSP